MKSKSPNPETKDIQADYWSVAPDNLLSLLTSSERGLISSVAEQRLKQYGRNTLEEHHQVTALGLFINQFKSPLVLILIFAASISLIVGEWTDASIVLAVVFGSTILGFAQEYSASNAVEKLRSQVTIKSNVLRDGQARMLPSEQIVPGDIVLLSAGSLIPADGILLSANNFFVNQAVLTGETFPVEKKAEVVAANASLAERTNCIFMGTSAGSGTAQALIVQTGKATMFGQIAERLSLHPPETEFERGIQRFGYLLTQVMLVMVIIVLAINILLAKPPIDSILFALALAVGLAPELLPAIISITLSHGAQKMAKRGVIVRRLNSIENFGSMDVLCTDKTGTLTEGVVRLDGAVDIQGQPSTAVLRYAYLNAHYQTGLSNPLDQAINSYAEKSGINISSEQKINEIPYDFIRKRLSVIVSNDQGKHTLITKGALEPVLSICTNIQTENNFHPLDDTAKAGIDRLYSEWSEKGFRVLGVAIKNIDDNLESYSRTDETNLSFTGFLLFFDPPKADGHQLLEDLANRAVQTKLNTGDNQKVARHVAEAVHLPITGILTGNQLNELYDEALWHAAERTTLFPEAHPNHKERIILPLHKTGHVIASMADGINITPPLYSTSFPI